MPTRRFGAAARAADEAGLNQQIWTPHLVPRALQTSESQAARRASRLPSRRWRGMTAKRRRRRSSSAQARNFFVTVGPWIAAAAPLR